VSRSGLHIGHLLTPRAWRLLKRDLQGHLFAAPWTLGFIVFTVGPMIASIYLSFTDYDVLTRMNWIGLGNYAKIFGDDELFWTSLYNTAYYVFLGVPIRMVLAIAIAMLLNQQIGGVAVYRTLYYLPSVVSGVALSMLWLWLFEPQTGLINTVLRMIGVAGPLWLGSETWSKPALIIMSLWGMGGSMVIYLAGLQAVPETLYEAAEIDGAGSWTKFWRITLPLLTPVVFFNLVTMIIGSFQVFTQAYVMTRGGPVHSTYFYVLYLYDKGFQYLEMGYASALAWILFWIILVFTLAQLKLSGRWVFYQAALGR